MRLVTLGLVGLIVSTPALAQERDLRGALDFEGRFIVSVSDADMIASAYVDGQLGPREGHDSLSVIRLGGDPRDWTADEVFASNSVAGPPNSVTLSPDARYAVVVETFTPRPDGEGPHTFRDLRHGRLLSVFDLSDPAAPSLVQTHETLERPTAISFNADGSLLAVSFHPRGAGTKTPLAIYRFKNGRIGERSTPAIEGWAQGDELIDIAFHPTESILALLDRSGGATLRFAEVGSGLSLSVVGNVVDLEREPFRIIWTPDGRHAIVNALYWGPDIAGWWIEAPRGSISTIRMNAETHDDGTVRHALVSRVMTGVSPEGLAVSPNGRWVATTNLERSYLPYGDPRITWFSSITLARLDPETGQLAEVGTFAYDGILPEAAVFDNSSTYLAVATYDHFDDRKTGGSIDFWRIQTDPLDAANLQLIKTEHSVPVARGVHSMTIIR